MDRKRIYIIVFIVTTIIASCFAIYFKIDSNKKINDLEIKKDENKLPKEFSPQTTYILVDEKDEIVGMVNIRWKEVPVLMSYGGMIGYSIRPSKRGQGYANEMLRLALEILFKVSKKQKILMTCKDFNISSKKVIEKNNGI